MAKRFTDTELWDKEWFMKLSCKHKCLVKMVRDKCDLSGVWSPNWIIASAYIGEPITEKELLGIDEGRQFKKIAGGKISCIGFVDFQYGTLTEKSPVHRKILNLLTSNKIPYQHPIDRVQEEEEEKEEDKEEEMEGEEEKEKEFQILEIKAEAEELEEYPTFEDFWDEYDKKKGEKGKLKKKWQALTLKDREAIMDYIPNYKASEPNKKFRKDPETFLNNKSWNDELIFDNGRKQQTTGNDKAANWANHFAKGTSTGS